jgi:hypothetical protein
LRESAAAQDHPSPDDFPDAVFDYMQRLLDTGEYPHVAELAAGGEPREVFSRMMATIFDEQRFERGLQRLLDGIALDVERRLASR